MGILETMAAIGIGAVVGGGQTYALREFVDKKYPDKQIAQLRGFGKPSALAGIGTGAVAAGYTVHRAYTKRALKDVEWFGFGYGAAALATAVFSGLNPAEAAAPAGMRRIIVTGPTGQRQITVTPPVTPGSLRGEL